MHHGTVITQFLLFINNIYYETPFRNFGHNFKAIISPFCFCYWLHDRIFTQCCDDFQAGKT